MYSEHAIILDAAYITLSLDHSWEEDSLKYENNLALMLDFFTFYGDKFHHQKEEEIIFRSLLKTDEPDIAMIINEMLEHHDDFRSTVSEIRELLYRKEYARAQEKISFYVNTIRDHIINEDEILFSLMDSIFSKEELDVMYDNCNVIDEKLGLKYKRELENYVTNLKIKSDEALQRAAYQLH